MSHPCPFTTCPVQIPDGQIACWPHWNALTEPQRERLNVLSTNRLCHKITADEFQAAQQEVIDTAEMRSSR